ncbi:MAG: oligosaccharide flippase family protein [bacterium]
MLSSLKRLAKHSAVYGLGHIVTRLVNFLLLPLYTNQLRVDEYGVSQVVYMYLGFMTIVYTFGIDAAFLRYFILSDNKEKRKHIFSTAFWAVAVAGAVFTLLIYLNPETNSRLVISQGVYPKFFRLAGFILLFDAMAFIPFLYLRAEEKSVHFVIVKFLNVIITVGLNIYFVVVLKKSVEGILLANVIASAATFVMLLPILIRQISFVFVWQEFKELLRFGLPYLPSTISVVALDVIDRTILERLVGLESTGIYSAGYKLGVFMNLFVAAFRFAWHPYFLSTSKQENAKEIFAKILTYFTLITSGIFLVISFFIDDIIRLNIFGVTLFGERYWESTRIVPFILLSYILYGMYVNFVVGIHLEKKTKYLPIITGLGAVVNIAANLLLIPKFDMMGAAYAKPIAYVAMTMAMYFFAQRYYRIPYEFSRLVKLAVVVTGLFYLGYYYHGAYSSLMKSGLLLAFPLLLLVIGFFQRKELETISKFFRNKRAKV